MKFDEYKALLQCTRSTRRFKSDISINMHDLEEVVECTRYISSAKNMQPLKYIIVTKDEIVQNLAKGSKWATHLTTWNQSEKEQPSAFIIVLNDTKIEGYPQIDCGIALQTITTGLKLKGYASCPLASIDKSFCKEVFRLDNELEPILGIAVGLEDETVHVVQATSNDTSYYRDEEDSHCVPKRDLDTILIGKY